MRGLGEIENRLHLHARSIDIARPDGGRLTAMAPLPQHMLATWALLGFEPERQGNPFERPAKAKPIRSAKPATAAKKKPKTTLRNKNKPKKRK